MELSKETQTIIDALDSYSNSNLRKKNDVAILIEICSLYSNIDTFSDIIFSSKILWNLSLKIQKISQGEEGAILIHKEFEDYLTKLRDYINLVAIRMEENEMQRFQEIYLAMTKGAVLNLIDLAHDLSILKELQSEIQRNTKKGGE